MNRFNPDPSRQLLCGDLSISVHQDDERRLPIIFHDKGFDDQMFIHAQFLGSHLRASSFFIFIGMLNEIDLIFSQHPDG